jgi:hypothetical protein
LSKQRKTKKLSGTPLKYCENQRFHLLSDKGTSKRLVGFKGLRWFMVWHQPTSTSNVWKVGEPPDHQPTSHWCAGDQGPNLVSGAFLHEGFKRKEGFKRRDK